MKVFTIQGENLRTFNQKLDSDKGTYAKNKKYSVPINKLYNEIVKTDQVIWCSDKLMNNYDRPCPLYRHTLEVNETDIFKK